MRILFCFLACIFVTECKIIIKDVGVATLTRGDVGMIFYLTLCNIGSCKYNVNVKMIKCCEKFGENDLDCRLMNLIGGDMGLLQPNVTKNISLLYPNMYLHNRKGQCLICLKYKTVKNRSFEAKETVVFDTFIRETHANPILRSYYNKHEYTKCKTVDEDPLDNCEPINCQMKYLGCRNYFNYKWRRCQKVPICIADPDKDLPDVSYLPISNMCRDLEDLISVDDLKLLETGTAEGCLNNQPTQDLLANVRCHHGILSNETGFCICDDGWMSAPFDKDQYEPSLSIYHMCNIEIDTWNGINSSKIKMTAVLLVIFGGFTTIFIIMLSFACHFLHKCIKSRNCSFKPKDKSDLQSPTQIESSASIEDDDILPSSESRNTSHTLRSRASVSVASRRDSKVFHKKFADHRRLSSDSSLRIVRRMSRQLSGLQEDSEESIEDTDVEETESFIPRRPKDDSD